MVFIPHDLDQLFRNERAPVMPHAHGIVARAILRDAQTRAAYRRRFAEIFTNVFVAPVLTQRIDDRVAMLAPRLKKYDPEMAADFVNNAENLKERIVTRARSIASQLDVAEPGRLVFTNDSVSVTGWRAANQQQNAKQQLVHEPSGISAFWISANGPSSASWRAKALLEPGRYVFEARARSAGVQPIANDRKGAGAGLRVSREPPQQATRLIGDVPWRKLAFEFTVATDNPEVDLICELRAQTGEVWFDEKSLRVTRVK
jgi:hypothetical protein